MLLLSKPLGAHGASCRFCTQDITTCPQVAHLVATTSEASANEVPCQLGQSSKARKCRSSRFCDVIGVNGRIRVKKCPQLDSGASEWMIGGAYV